MRAKVLGKFHVDVAEAYAFLGFAQKGLGDEKIARESQETCLEIRIKLLGADHPKVANSYYNLARHLSSMGLKDEALQCAQSALETYIVCFGEDHQRTRAVSEFISLHEKNDQVTRQRRISICDA